MFLEELNKLQKQGESLRELELQVEERAKEAEKIINQGGSQKNLVIVAERQSEE